MCLLFACMNVEVKSSFNTQYVGFMMCLWLCMGKVHKTVNESVCGYSQLAYYLSVGKDVNETHTIWASLAQALIKLPVAPWETTAVMCGPLLLDDPCAPDL